ncbi:hypothetical protein QL285_093493 [Trifolium repens]|jgi:hypothetical protein|nr:hypothetical protein QL285_093493 [Trifolium repens]
MRVGENKIPLFVRKSNYTIGPKYKRKPIMAELEVKGLPYSQTLLFLPLYGFLGAPYEMTKILLSVTSATDTPQKHPTIITSVT